MKVSIRHFLAVWLMVLLAGCHQGDVPLGSSVGPDNNVPDGPGNTRPISSYSYIRALCADEDRNVVVKVRSPLNDLDTVSIDIKAPPEKLGILTGREPAVLTLSETEFKAISANFELLVDLETDSGVPFKFLGEVTLPGDEEPIELLCRRL